MEEKGCVLNLPSLTCVVNLPSFQMCCGTAQLTCAVNLPSLTCVVSLPSLMCVVNLPGLTCVVNLQYDDDWKRRDVLGIHPQRQEGLYWVGALIPVGRLHSDDMDALATVADRLAIRVCQSLILQYHSRVK